MRNFWKYRVEIFLFFLAISLRLLNLGKQSLWMDEAFSVWLAHHSIPEIFQILKIDAHPPLFYLFLHFWMRVGTNETFLRLPFALLGGLNTLLVYRLGKACVGSRAALLTGSFWGIAFAIFNSEAQVRMYSMAACFSLLMTLAFLDLNRKQSPNNWIKYLLPLMLGIYTHYYVALVWLGHLLFTVWQKKIKRALFLLGAFGVVFIPLTPLFYQQLLVRLHPGLSVSKKEWLAFSGLLGNTPLIRNFTFNIAISVVSFFMVLREIYRAFSAKKENLSLLSFLLFTLFVIPILLSQFTPLKIFLFRYSIFFAPYFLLIFFNALLQIHRIVIASVLIFLTVLNIANDNLFLSNLTYQRQPWRSVALLLRANLSPNDTVWAEQLLSFFPLWYYLPDQFQIKYFPTTDRKGIFSLIPLSRSLWVPVEGATPSQTLHYYCFRANRVWLILCQSDLSDPEGKVQNWLFKHAHQIAYRKLISLDPDNVITIFLFKP